MSAPIEVQLSEGITAALKRLAERGADMSPAMQEIAGLLESETSVRFQTETDPADVPWKKSLRVTGYTAADGEKVEGDGGQTLTLHGYLRKSIKTNYGADFAEAGPEASGPAAIYAAIHQFGDKIVPKRLLSGETHLRALNTPFGRFASVTIPARPYLGWNPAIEEEAVEILLRHAGAALDAGGPAA